MEYQQGHLGRVFLVKMEHGDDLLKEIKDLAIKEKIASAYMLMIGAIQQTTMVVGPEDCTVPPVGVEAELHDGREIVGIGTWFNDADGNPQLHIHSALGRGVETITGCLRSNTKIYLVAEVLVLELEGFNVSKEVDPVLQVKALLMKQAKPL